MARPSRFSPEVRERAIRMMFGHAQDHPPGSGRRPGLTTDERTRFEQLERENVELQPGERDPPPPADRVLT